MGSTLVAGAFWSDGYAIANVGDSRALLVSHAEIEQLTLDHSSAAEQVRAGHMNATAATNHALAHALTRCVGSEEDLNPDLFPETGGLFPAGDSCAVVLLSDGVWNVLSEYEIADLVLGTGNAQEAAEQLIAYAVDRGTNDNVSAVVVELGELQRGKRLTRILPALIDGPGNEAQSPNNQANQSSSTQSQPQSRVSLAMALLGSAAMLLLILWALHQILFPPLSDESSSPMPAISTVSPVSGSALRESTANVTDAASDSLTAVELQEIDP